MADQSVASLVERMTRLIEAKTGLTRHEAEATSKALVELVCFIRDEATKPLHAEIERLREAASRLSSPALTHDELANTVSFLKTWHATTLAKKVIAVLSSPDGTRGRQDVESHSTELGDARVSPSDDQQKPRPPSPSSAPDATPAKAHGNSSAEVERSRQVQLQALLVDIAQIFDGWHQDGTAWTTHDESVRRRLSEFMEASPRVSAATPAPERQFPVMDDPDPLRQHRHSLPWWIVSAHEEQAKKNHFQSLEDLARRGGLDPTELCAVLEDRAHRSMPRGDARVRVECLIQSAVRISAAERPAPTCATCKWFNDGRCRDERMFGETMLYDNSMKGNRVWNPREFGCTLHEPAPPYPVAQEKE